MGQDPHQFPFPIHGADHSGGDEDVAPRDREGIHGGIIDHKKAVGEGLGPRPQLGHQFLPQPVQIGLDKRVGHYLHNLLDCQEKLFPQLPFFLNGQFPEKRSAGGVRKMTSRTAMSRAAKDRREVKVFMGPPKGLPLEVGFEIGGVKGGDRFAPGDVHPGRLGPKPFQIIEFPEGVKKDMNHHVIIIHQHPEALLQALHPQGLDSRPGQGFFQMVGDGQDLARGAAGSDGEEIGKGTQVFYFQDDGLKALVGHNGLADQIHQGFPGQGGGRFRRVRILLKVKLLVQYIFPHGFRQEVSDGAAPAHQAADAGGGDVHQGGGLVQDL